MAAGVSGGDWVIGGADPIAVQVEVSLASSEAGLADIALRVVVGVPVDGAADAAKLAGGEATEAEPVEVAGKVAGGLGDHEQFDDVGAARERDGAEAGIDIFLPVAGGGDG